MALVFRGNDIHSGFSPSIHSSMQTAKLTPQQFSNVNHVWRHAVNRVAYVLYQPTRATQRTTSFSVTPATFFGNHGVLSPTDTLVLNYAQEGRHILGTPTEAATRLAREASMGFLNTLAASGLTINSDLTSLMSAISFSHPRTNSIQPVGPAAFEPSQLGGSPFIDTMKRYYRHYYDRCMSLHLGISKHMYKAVQAAVAEGATAQSVIIASRLQMRPVTLGIQAPAELPTQLIKEVQDQAIGGGGKVLV